MLILGIETSCDETAAAVVQDGTKILSNVVASSEELHKKTGGIIPELAAREQLKYLLPVIDQAIRNTQYAIRKSFLVSPISSRHLDAIAVTTGPGLIGSLIVGIHTARTLAYLWEKPILPVNHLPAHLYANFLNSQQLNNRTIEQSILPAVGLIASGGHTDLVLFKKHQDLKWLGGTRDDAAGECFDKCARILGLGYPGGPAIEKAANKIRRGGSRTRPHLPRPMLNQNNFDFSFSGLKTALLNIVRRGGPAPTRPLGGCPPVTLLASEVQEAITDCLVTKTLRAAQKYQVKSILLGGGVAANSRLRQKFKLEIGNCPPSACRRRGRGKLEIGLCAPPPTLCTDNAASIASYAFFNYHPLPWQKVKPQPNLHLF